MKTRTVTSSLTGTPVPVTMDLGVKPLFRSGKPVKNGNGDHITNDRWIYVQDGRNGCYAINVNRARYCEKMYLSQITIRQTIEDKAILSPDLKLFIDKVSDKIVFQKYGHWYKVFLRKIKRTYTIDKVIPYVAIYAPNAMVLGHYAHELCIDWREKFYVHGK